MATVDTLRPNAVLSGSGWSAVSSGTLADVTSDDSDATYALWSGTGSALLLSVGNHSVPTGHRRHLARLRVRGQSGSCYWAVRTSTGELISYSAATFGSVSTVAGSWATGLPPSVAGSYACYVVGQTTNLRIVELYLDIDSREAPTYAIDILDGGSPTTTVTGTNTPTIEFNTFDYDGLNPREWRAWITQVGTIVWDTGVVGGPASQVVTAPLSNGPYVLNTQIWTTVGANSAYPSAIVSEVFTVNVADVDAPVTVTVTQLSDSPLFQIVSLAPPSLSDYDSNIAYTEFQRIDCNGTHTVAIVGPISANNLISYLDWQAPRTITGIPCTSPGDDCTIMYRARLVGQVSDQLVTSPWVDATGTFTLNMNDGEHILRTLTPDGPVWFSACGEISWDVDRPFTVSSGVNGGRVVTTGAVGGRDFSADLTVTSESHLYTLETILDSALILLSPADAPEQYSVPLDQSTNVIKVGRIRTVSTKMVGTGPEPSPNILEVF